MTISFGMQTKKDAIASLSDGQIFRTGLSSLDTQIIFYSLANDTVNSFRRLL